MPIYEFACPACGHRQERIVPIAQRDDAPICEGNPFERHDARRCERVVSCASFTVNGFNEINGYASPRTIRKNLGNGIKTQVSGNFEAFSERLTSK